MKKITLNILTLFFIQFLKPLKKYFLLVWFLIPLVSFCQTVKLNNELSSVIDSMVIQDQKSRYINNADSAEKIFQQIIHSNFSLVKEIADKYGFPGYDLVGKESAHNYWILVQHSDFDVAFQKRILALMLPQVKKNNAGSQDYAYLTDRININEGKKQIYGTQYIMDIKGTKLKPCIDSINLDNRRKQVGLSSVKEYLQHADDIFYELNKSKFEDLKKELDSIYIADQKYRILIQSNDITNKADSLAGVFSIPKSELVNYIVKQIPLVDSSNIKRIVALIDKYGYPGKRLVGIPTNEVAWSVIQHSTKIDYFLPVIKDAAERGEINFTLYATMLDRSDMYLGKEQIYGTQGKGLSVINPLTGKAEWKMIIWPIKDAAHVNRIRNKAGFKKTIEESASSLGISYKAYTLKDVSKMQIH